MYAKRAKGSGACPKKTWVPQRGGEGSRPVPNSLPAADESSTARVPPQEGRSTESVMPSMVFPCSVEVLASSPQHIDLTLLASPPGVPMGVRLGQIGNDRMTIRTGSASDRGPLGTTASEASRRFRYKGACSASGEDREGVKAIFSSHLEPGQTLQQHPLPVIPLTAVATASPVGNGRRWCDAAPSAINCFPHSDTWDQTTQVAFPHSDT